MDWNALSDEAFRQEAARFVRERCPPELRFFPRRPRWHEMKPWYLIMSSEGWLAPGWPREWGGMGLSASKQLAYLEEFELNGAPGVMAQGVTNVGPALIRYGTEAQRARFLPPILSGEHFWCQGFSEPGAGSDLASLRTEARLEGDEFIINGHKIWTSNGADANWMYALVRTDKSVKKQVGISFLMFETDQPGLTRRTIKTLPGGTEFCEVFFDNVRAKAENLVGGLNQGWTVANSVLGFERLWAGSSHQPRDALHRLEKLMMDFGVGPGDALRDRVTQLELDVRDLNATYKRTSAALQAAGRVGHEVSVLKIWSAETLQRINELALEVAQQYGALEGPIACSSGDVNAMHQHLSSRAATIYGGTTQIHRNILAKNVLSLV